jgi:O-antigen/teichoic acid export membrane protein
MPGVVALVLQGPFVDYLLVENRVLAVTVATVTSVVVNVAMNVVLLRDHTFVAAAVASTVCYFVSCLWSMWLFHRDTHVTWRDTWLLRGADISALRLRRSVAT